MKKLALAMGLVLGVGAGTAMAVGTNGNTAMAVNASATGKIMVNGVIPTLVQLRNLNDITLSAYADGSNMTASDSFCAFTNASSGQVDIVVTATDSTDAAATGSFVLDDGSGNTLPYSVDIGGNIAYGGTAAGLTADCSTDNITMTVTVQETDAEAAVPGNYAGHVVLTASAI